MFKVIDLIELLKKDKISYFKLHRSIQKFSIDKIHEIGFTEPEYKVSCVIRRFNGYDADVNGRQFDDNGKIGICINSLLLYAFLFNGYEGHNRIELFHNIFHELWHVKFKKDEYRDEELNKELAVEKYFVKGDNNPYYYANYNVHTEELLCNMYAVQDTLKFFKDNNLYISDEEIKFLEDIYNKNKEKLNNKTRLNPIDKNNYSLDELYEMVISSKMTR